MTCFEVDEFLVVPGDLFDVALSLGRSLWFDKSFVPQTRLVLEKLNLLADL